VQRADRVYGGHAADQRRELVVDERLRAPRCHRSGDHVDVVDNLDIEHDDDVHHLDQHDQHVEHDDGPADAHHNVMRAGRAHR